MYDPKNKNSISSSRTHELAKRCWRTAAVCAAALTVMATPVLAEGEGDVLTTVNNLSDLVFSVIRVVGIIICGWGIVQLGMSIQSHDASQRSQGILAFVGGLFIVFAKAILTTIGAI